MRHEIADLESWKDHLARIRSVLPAVAGNPSMFISMKREQLYVELLLGEPTASTLRELVAYSGAHCLAVHAARGGGSGVVTYRTVDGSGSVAIGESIAVTSWWIAYGLATLTGAADVVRRLSDPELVTSCCGSSGRAGGDDLHWELVARGMSASLPPAGQPDAFAEIALEHLEVLAEDLRPYAEAHDGGVMRVLMAAAIGEVPVAQAVRDALAGFSAYWASQPDGARDPQGLYFLGLSALLERLRAEGPEHDLPADVLASPYLIPRQPGLGEISFTTPSDGSGAPAAPAAPTPVAAPPDAAPAASARGPAPGQDAAFPEELRGTLLKLLTSERRGGWIASTVVAVGGLAILGFLAVQGLRDLELLTKDLLPTLGAAAVGGILTFVGVRGVRNLRVDPRSYAIAHPEAIQRYIMKTQHRRVGGAATHARAMGFDLGRVTGTLPLPTPRDEAFEARLADALDRLGAERLG